MRVRLISRKKAALPYTPGSAVHVGDDEASKMLAKGSAEPISDLFGDWPQDGCVLDEACWRTADSSHWTNALKAENALAASGGRGRRRAYRSAGVDADPEVLRQVELETRRRQLERSADAAWHPVRTSFQQMLINGRLIATGADARPSEPVSVIPSHAWRHMQVRDWRRSVAVERTPAKDTWYEIRVYPAPLSPRRVDLLAGHSLVEAFRKFVLEDPELEAVLRRLGHRTFAQLPDFQSLLPIELGPYTDFGDFLSKTRSFWNTPDLSSGHIRQAYAIFWHRLARFLEPLRRGELIARGTYYSGGNVTAVDVSQWSRASHWIDVSNGDLIDKTRSPHETRERVSIRWTGLALFHVKATTSDALLPTTAEIDRKRKTRVSTQARHEAAQQCEAWLEGLMRASPRKRRASKSALGVEAREKWPALSERSFLNAWARAIQSTGAVAWSFAGAPSKRR